jgi:small GTP-binding protein
MDYTGRVIVVGPANVGKTALLERYVQGVFSRDTKPTLGCDCTAKIVTVGRSGKNGNVEERVKLNLYDTAGQERYAEIASNYFRRTDVCLLCFDLANLASFDHIRWWREKVIAMNPNCLFILVGTKMDLLKGIPGETEFARRFAAESKMPFFSTSSLEGGDQIEFLFYCVAEKILHLRLQSELDNKTKPVGFAVANEPSRSATTPCCGTFS